MRLLRSPRRTRNDILLAVLLLSVVFLWTAVVYSIPADVRDISDSKYYDVVHESLGEAQESIYVSLFGLIVRENDKLSLPYLLAQDLIEAHKRGVKVIVRLDKSYDYIGSERTEELSDKNDVACLMLLGAGIDCKFTAQDKVLHDKLIVIDRKIVIEGSMNWSLNALRRNRESVTLIESEEYAKEKIIRIESLKTTYEGDLDRAQVETVRVSNKFLNTPGLAGEMIHARDETAFNMCLLFLKDFKETGKSKFELDYMKICRYLGLELEEKRFSRDKVNKVLRRLKRKYKLIECEIKRNEPTYIALLNYEGRAKEYEAPEKGYFNVPLAYWEYGWDRKLSLRGKFCYLVNLFQTEISYTKPWWTHSLENLDSYFHVDKWTIMRGMRELKKMGIVEVEYDMAVNKDGTLRDDRKPNKYKLNPLFSQEQMDKKWQELEGIYGSELVKKARRLAFMMEMGDSIEGVEDFIRLMGRYPEEWVEKATNMTARRKADNPSRTFGFIVGILKNWDEQGYTN